MTRKARIVSFISFPDETWWQKRCHGDEQHYFAVRYLRAHVAEVGGTTIRVTNDVLVTMENSAGIASVGTASSKDWPGNIFEGVLCRYVGFEASLETFPASDFFEVLVTAFPRSGIFTMVTFQAVHYMGKYFIIRNMGILFFPRMNTLCEVRDKAHILIYNYNWTGDYATIFFLINQRKSHNFLRDIRHSCYAVNPLWYKVYVYISKTIAVLVRLIHKSCDAMMVFIFQTRWKDLEDNMQRKVCLSKHMC